MRHASFLRLSLFSLGVLVLSGCAKSRADPPVSQNLSPARLPAMAWDHRPEAAQWTRATLAALQGDGAVLTSIVPRGIMEFCPAYPDASTAERAAFWSGILSALAKHESTWRPEASGGGGRWIGLTQIDPRTARAYDCDATSVAALKDGSANLSCAVKIAASQVGRDNELVGGPGRWRGLGRDWAPFRDPAKRADMSAWTRAQSYCRG